MRKETSSGLIAGIVSALPVGIAFAAWALWLVFFSGQTESGADNFLLIGSVMMVLMSLAFATFFGAIAGLIFVVATNKLPIRSTYVKAIIPAPVLWVLYLLVSAWISEGSLRGFAYRAGETVEAFSVMVLGTVLFAYLFDRWTK